jgi:activator of 2-hydroxyglutaryl-CoA dehydratase
VSFVCPVCIGEKTKGFTEPPHELSRKKGYRIIGIDNATRSMGISLFENGKLIYYKLFTYKSGSHIHRLNEIRDIFEEIIIPI